MALYDYKQGPDTGENWLSEKTSIGLTHGEVMTYTAVLIVVAIFVGTWLYMGTDTILGIR